MVVQGRVEIQVERMQVDERIEEGGRIQEDKGVQLEGSVFIGVKGRLEKQFRISFRFQFRVFEFFLEGFRFFQIIECFEQILEGDFVSEKFGFLFRFEEVVIRGFGNYKEIVVGFLVGGFIFRVQLIFEGVLEQMGGERC